MQLARLFVQGSAMEDCKVPAWASERFRGTEMWQHNMQVSSFGVTGKHLDLNICIWQRTGQVVEKKR